MGMSPVWAPSLLEWHACHVPGEADTHVEVTEPSSGSVETSQVQRPQGYLRLALPVLWLIPGYREAFLSSIQGGPTTGSVCSQEVLWCGRVVDL